MADYHDADGVGEVVLPTGGGCMRPLIWPGGQIHVRRCDIQSVRVNDIVVWFDGKHFVSHRVIRTSADAIVTQADWAIATDPPTHKHQLVGTAVRFSLGPVSYSLHGRVPVLIGLALRHLHLCSVALRESAALLL